MEISNDLFAALLCQIIYDKPAYFDKVIDNGSVFLGCKVIDGKRTVACRGSYTGRDWLHDIESIETVEHPVLGRVGKGFIIGVDDSCLIPLKAFLGEDKEQIVYIIAHSLGCPHAFYVAGLLIKDGYKVDIAAFEPPRACSQTLIDILAPYPVRCYRNGDDFVTQVPIGLKHPRDLIALHCPPVSGDESPFKWHHTPLVITGIAQAALGV